MGILDRMSSLFKSNVNSALDKMTDPGKQVEQLILEMEEQERIARGETVSAMATQKRCASRITDLEKDIHRWSDRAEAALNAGDEGLARQALERKVAVEADLLEARREHKEAAEYAGQLEAALGKLGSRIREFRMRKGTIKAKASMAKKSITPGSTDAFEDFERMSGVVDDRESAVEAEAELSSSLETRDDAALQKFAKLTGKTSSDVDDRLAALKKKLDK